MTPLPIQYTTSDASLIGDVDGANRSYYFVPVPNLLLCSATGIRSFLMFWNGLLVDQPGDYVAHNGYFVFNSSVQFDTATALAYTDTAPSILRLSDTSITAFGSNSLRISFGNAAFVAQRQFVLFRNGLRLTDGLDYTSSGPWINLVAGQEILDGDQYSVLIGPVGTACSTANGTITGLIDGLNLNFEVPNTGPLWLFKNGIFLTEGLDFSRYETTVSLRGQAPLPGDTLTGQLLPAGYSFTELSTFSDAFISSPVATQSNTVDGSITGSIDGYNAAFTIPEGSQNFWLFRDGQLLTNDLDYSRLGQIVTLAGDQVPIPGDLLTGQSFASGNMLQASTYAGSITGTIDGVNPDFVVPSGASSLWLFRNGQLLTRGLDYTLAVDTVTLLGTAIPSGDDVLTAKYTSATFSAQISTFDNSITGTINGVNDTFTVPDGSAGIWISRNGQFLTELVDYIRAGAVIIMSPWQIPIVGDVLTGQAYQYGPSAVFSVYGGGLTFSVAAASWVFADGLILPQLGSAQADGNSITLTDAAISGSTITAESWVQIASEPEQPALNFGTQYSSDDGGISGDMNSSNAVFTINDSGLITQVMLFVNRRFLVQNRDYAWTGNTITMLAGSIPDAGDVFTSIVFSD